MALASAFAASSVKLGRTLARKITGALAARDDNGEIDRDSKGRPQADPELRDYEDVPLDQDVQSWFEHEVLPHAPDAWIGEPEPRTGYIIPFARYFLEPQPVRPLEEIDREIRNLERESQSLLAQLGTK